MNLDKKKGLKFILKFNLILIPLYLIGISGFRIYEFELLTAGLSFKLLNLFLSGASIDNTIIYVPIKYGSFGAVIDWECTGWKSMIFLSSLFFATETTNKKRLWLLAFLPIIYLFNIARIVSLFYYTSAFGPENLDFMHTYIGGFGIIFLAAFLWYIWKEFLINKSK